MLKAHRIRILASAMLVLAFLSCRDRGSADPNAKTGMGDSTVSKVDPDGGVLDDTMGIGQFLDSLQRDFDRGSMSLFLSRIGQGFDGGNVYTCSDDGCQLKSDTSFARSTAQVLGWTLRYGGFKIRHPGGGELQVMGPFIGDPRFQVSDPKVEEAEANSDDTTSRFGGVDTSIYVGDTTQPLFAKIGGERIGSVHSRWVMKLGSTGGFRPAEGDSLIHETWVRVRTPDGREGWTSGEGLRDANAPGPILGLYHFTKGWRILQMTDPNDND